MATQEQLFGVDNLYVATRLGKTGDLREMLLEGGSVQKKPWKTLCRWSDQRRKHAEFLVTLFEEVPTWCVPVKVATIGKSLNM